MTILKILPIPLGTSIVLFLFILFILSFLESETLAVSLNEVTIPPGSSNPIINGFEPATLSIPIGATVKWTNEDSTLHTVTSGSAEGGESGTIFDSSYMTGGKTFQWTFSNTGSFEYYCTLHPFMTAKIVVVNSPTGIVTTDNQVKITNPNISNELLSQHINASSNATANATGEAMTQAMNLLKMASSAASNATQTAMNTASNDTANATGEAVNEANELINAASSAASNATQTAIDQTQNILANITSNVSKLAANPSPNVTSPTMTNYSSNLYQIQFQYPATWELKEKTGRFDEGSDLEIRNQNLGGEFILMQYGDDPRTDFGSNDFTAAFYDLFKDTISGDVSYEYRVIEQPSFTTIDSQKAGTFLYTFKDKYEENSWLWGSQNWLVYVSGHAYLISFTATTDIFDSPENIEIRDNFIKSINFLGKTTQLNSTIPNRFN